MSIRGWESWFNNDFQSRRNQFLGSDSESFVRNGDDLPVDVLLTTFVTTAPVDVTLSVSFAWPVLGLTFSGTVSSLLATTTQFGGQSTNIETVGAVPDDTIFSLSKHVVNITSKRKKKKKMRFKCSTDRYLHRILGLHSRFSYLSIQCLSLLLYSQIKVQVTNKTSNPAEQQNESAAVGCCWTLVQLCSEQCCCPSLGETGSETRRERERGEALKEDEPESEHWGPYEAARRCGVDREGKKGKVLQVIERLGRDTTQELYFSL